MAGRSRCSLFLHSFGYRFRLTHDPGFTFFDVIADARRRGFDGINVSIYPPEYTHLSGGSADHVRRVRDALDDAGIGIDVETSGTEPQHLRHVMAIGRELGARHLRTCTRMAPGGVEETMARAVADLEQIAPEAAASGITIVVENHEDLVSGEVARLLATLDSPAVRGLFDYGNDVMVSEVPSTSLTDLLPWVVTAHLKDQVFVPSVNGSTPLTVGVPFGAGTIPIRALTQRLLDAGVGRICAEPTWGYVARVQPPRTPNDVGDDPVFAPRPHLPDDERFCFDPLALLAAEPQRLFDTEARMLDLCCESLVRSLAGLPITAPRPA